MPRPLTKGPNIQFRLPLEDHEWVEAQALEHDENVSVFVARNFTRIVRAQRLREQADA